MQHQSHHLNNAWIVNTNEVGGRNSVCELGIFWMTNTRFSKTCTQNECLKDSCIQKQNTNTITAYKHTLLHIYTHNLVAKSRTKKETATENNNIDMKVVTKKLTDKKSLGKSSWKSLINNPIWLQQNDMFVCRISNVMSNKYGH